MADPTSTAEKSTESNGTPVEEWPPVASTTMEAHRRQQRADDYITGWPLYIILGATWLSLFVSQMESSIASTAILTVTNELGGYSKSSWIFTAYMLTYSGFPIIWGKVSDIFGRKTCLLTALLVFVVFSAACGAAQTIIQLIMFRWLQGIGGSGIYSIATLVQWELLPPEKWATNTSFVTGIIALSLVAGPLIGGGITQGGSWRWIFLINCPIIPVAATLLLWKFPRRLSNEHAAIYASESLASRLSLKHLRRIDVIGGFLLLACCLLISTGLQEAAEGRSWTSAVVLALIIVGGISIPIFLLWQWYVTAKLPYPEPVFPWRFVQSRIFIGMIMNAFLAGIVLSVCIVQLPQRFMTVNGLSPLAAGARLLPFGAFAPVGASISAGLMDKARIPPVYICVIGMILEIIGLVFLSRASGDRHINASQYGFQIITAVGNGYLQTASVLLIPYIVQNRDLAVSNATMAQFRILGGAIGISIATAASQPFVQNRLLRILPADAVLTILGRTGGIESLPDAMQSTVRSTFADGYNLQMKILIGIASAHAIPILLMWTRKPIVISRKKAAQHDSRTDSVSV